MSKNKSMCSVMDEGKKKKVENGKPTKKEGNYLISVNINITKKCNKIITVLCVGNVGGELNLRDGNLENNCQSILDNSVRKSANAAVTNISAEFDLYSESRCGESTHTPLPMVSLTNGRNETES